MSRPVQAWSTLADAIRGIPGHFPNHGFRFLEDDGSESMCTFAELEARTAGVSSTLQSAGLRKGDRLGLIVAEPSLFVPIFLGAVRAGVVPVPLYPPTFLGHVDVYLDHAARILSAAGATLLITSAPSAAPLEPLIGRVPTLRAILAADAVAMDGSAVDSAAAPDDLAFLQYTSGSTSRPRGVRVHHGALVANIQAFMGDGLDMDPSRDTGVSWLPLYHDMGLVGFILGPLFWGVTVTVIPTMRFVKNPSVWLETIHRHRGTVSFAPNFAYARMAQKAKGPDLARWDLSCVKAFGCGAEPIHPSTFRRFSEVFGRCGLRPSALLPAYGLAESTLAVTMKPLEETYRVLAATEAGRRVEHVSCGKPFPHHRLEIRDPDGQPAPDGVEGDICVSGPSIASGYFGDEPESQRVWQDGWLLTGDKGIFLAGELYVTGRTKDLVIVNGRNVHPQSVESAASEVAGVREGSVVAFARPSARGEELIVAFETNHVDPAEVILAVRECLVAHLGLSPREVVSLPPGTLPKTSSGKVQRQLTRSRYLDGVYSPKEKG